MENSFGLDENTINKLNDLMYPQNQYIEITQDAAAFCSFSNSLKGIYTDGVETCIIWIVRYDHGILMIHDSGQLLLSEMATLIKKYGEPQGIGIHHGFNYSDRRHKLRIENLCQQIGCANPPLMLNSEMNSFSVLQERDGGFVYSQPKIKPPGLIPLPDHEKRINIVNFNNFFLEPSSQSLSIDLQHDGNSYLNNTTPLHSVKTVLDAVESQPTHFYNNLLVLHPIVAKNIVSFPEWFIRFISNYLNANGSIKESNEPPTAIHKRFVQLKHANK